MIKAPCNTGEPRGAEIRRPVCGLAEYPVGVVVDRCRLVHWGRCGPFREVFSRLPSVHLPISGSTRERRPGVLMGPNKVRIIPFK